MPPASSGGVTMGEILNIMEGYDPLPPFGSRRAACTARPRRCGAPSPTATRYLGDPAFVQIPIDRLLSQELRGRAPRSRSASAPRRRPAFEPAPAHRCLDHALLGGGRRGQRRELHHDAQQQLRQRA